MALDFEIILNEPFVTAPLQQECSLFNSADLELPECFSDGLSCRVVEFDCYDVGDNMLIYITIST